MQFIICDLKAIYEMQFIIWDVEYHFLFVWSFSTSLLAALQSPSYCLLATDPCLFWDRDPMFEVT